MAKYRKKPVVIEAFQWTGGVDPHPQWMIDAIRLGNVYYQGGDRPYLTIETLEGKMRANQGDFIICGVSGEIYPCKPDIFAKTYEPIEAT